MNSNHANLCPSPEWARYLQTEVLPALTSQVDLGKHMLEIGPGPGASTDWLRHRVDQLTVLEVDPEAAAKLSHTYRDTNVEVVVGDATQPGYPDETFDSIGSFTMLHHVPTQALQNKILAEAFRMLKPGGVFIASDSLASNDLHHFHVDDTYNPIDPSAALCRLQVAGFSQVTVIVDDILKFIVRKPVQGEGCHDDDN
jgi:ubiquinone/menaquinone biosynthesis C-methylase UbiE